MKVLTIKEPFATLIMEKKKSIETRSWKTNYRGELYIHAGLSNYKYLDSESKELIKDIKLNHGNIICKCNLVDCVYMDEEFIENIKKNHIEYLFGRYEVGRYAWILEDVVKIDKIPAKGKLSIWTK